MPCASSLSYRLILQRLDPFRRRRLDRKRAKVATRSRAPKDFSPQRFEESKIDFRKIISSYPPRTHARIFFGSRVYSFKRIRRKSRVPARVRNSLAFFVSLGARCYWQSTLRFHSVREKKTGVRKSFVNKIIKRMENAGICRIVIT